MTVEKIIIQLCRVEENCDLQNETMYFETVIIIALNNSNWRSEWKVDNGLEISNNRSSEVLSDEPDHTSIIECNQRRCHAFSALYFHHGCEPRNQSSEQLVTLYFSKIINTIRNFANYFIWHTLQTVFSNHFII